MKTNKTKKGPIHAEALGGWLPAAGAAKPAWRAFIRGSHAERSPADFT